MNQYSLIICTYNRSAFLKDTIESVLSNLKDNTKFELLVVDNNSKDNTAEVVKPFLSNPLVRYVLEKEQGLSAARNRGIKEALYPILVFIDDDIDIHPNYLKVLDQIYKDPTVKIAGGKVLPYKAEIPAWLPEQYYYLASVFDMGDKQIYVSKLLGANHSFRKEVANEVGGYNPKIGPNGNFKLGGDENEFLFRAQQKGYRILYHPDLIVYHKIENRFNKEFILMYAFNVSASEANIDFAQRKTRFALKTIKYMAETLADKANMFKKNQSGFIDDIKREQRRGYLDFAKSSVGN